MIIFSSKVYSIIPLVSRAKAVLTNETVGVTVFLGSVFRLAFMYFTDLTIKDLNFYLNFLNVNFFILLMQCTCPCCGGRKVLSNDCRA